MAFGRNFVEGTMQTLQRSGELKAFLKLVSGVLLLGACTHTTVAPQSDALTRSPIAAQRVFVGPFNGEFAREMRAAVGAELQKSPRYRVVDTEAAAEFVLSGSILINTRQTNQPVVAPPSGFVQLLSRASGTNVWQYTYRDQRTGGELVMPTPRQQVQAVARQFVAQLLSIAIASTASDKATY